jgi:protoporphyrinogen oxidase
MSERPADDHAVIYLVGAGIASLAAAAFLIRDGDVPGHNITILEESERIGGSLDAGSPTCTRLKPAIIGGVRSARARLKSKVQTLVQVFLEDEDFYLVPTAVRS